MAEAMKREKRVL